MDINDQNELELGNYKIRDVSNYFPRTALLLMSHVLFRVIYSRCADSLNFACNKIREMRKVLENLTLICLKGFYMLYRLHYNTLNVLLP